MPLYTFHVNAINNLVFFCWYNKYIIYIRVTLTAPALYLLASSVPGSGQTSENTIGMCCFSAKHVALMEKSSEL
jgi:hypothetical protein